MNRVDITALRGLTHVEVSPGAIPAENTSASAAQHWSSGATMPIGIVFIPAFHQLLVEPPLIEVPDDDDDEFWLAVVTASMDRWDERGGKEVV